MPSRSTRFPAFLALVIGLFVVLAACGGDDTDDLDDIAVEPDPTPTVTSDDAVDDPEPTPTPEPEEPAEDFDLAPELAGLTDWRNTDPVSLEDLRGEPVVLVFWNSI